MAALAQKLWLGAVGGPHLARADLVAAVFFAITDANGEATRLSSIPNEPALAGLSTYRQRGSLSADVPLNGVPKLSDGLEIATGKYSGLPAAVRLYH